MKEKVLEALAEMGFKTEKVEDLGYGFSYEGSNFVWMDNGEDEDFLNIALPSVYEFTSDNVVQSCAISQKVNSTLKYIKAYALGDSLWLFYERELTGDEDLEMLLSRMILRLDNALGFTRKAIQEIENTVSGNDDEDEEDDSAAEDTDAVEITDDEDNSEK